MANEELEFANDPLGAVASTGTSPAWRVVLTIGCAVGAAIMWADWAEVEQVTSGQGKVIPSSQIQVVESLEPGIVAEILIREGDRVAKGQELIRIDDTGAASKLGELRQRQASLTAEKLRIRAQLNGESTFEILETPDASIRDFYLDQRAVFTANRKILDEQASTRRHQFEQKRQSLAENVASAEKNARFARSGTKRGGSDRTAVPTTGRSGN